MTPRRLYFALLLWAIAAPTPRAIAQTSTATLSADIGSFARLTLSSASVSFGDADPDTVPQIPSLGGPLLITVKARAAAASQVRLALQASDDLRSGVTTIPVSNLTWTATGAGFAAGTASKSTTVTVGSWSGSGIRSGSQQLYFRNQWTYPTGTFTVSLVYTLTAP